VGIGLIHIVVRNLGQIGGLEQGAVVAEA
jgi:hypothetical protein